MSDLIKSDVMLRVDKLCKFYGGLAANTDISLDVMESEILAIIGPNGAGKTTLIQQLSGETRPTSGRIIFSDVDITTTPPWIRARRGLARSFQITSIMGAFSARDNVAFSAQAHAGHSFRFWHKASGIAALNDRAMDMLDLVGLTARAEIPAASLSHGEQRQLEIAMALVMQPKLMLLDEPTAGMGREESLAFVDLIRRIRQSQTIILVEHDMHVVFALADRIAVLANGRLIALDVPPAIRANPAVRTAYLGDSVAA